MRACALSLAPNLMDCKRLFVLLTLSLALADDTELPIGVRIRPLFDIQPLNMPATCDKPLNLFVHDLSPDLS